MEKETPLEKFVNGKKQWEEKHIQLAILYELRELNLKSEKNRSNTSKLVWWLIALPFLLGMLSLFGCSDNDNDSCPCETIREYTIENCDGTDYSSASNAQLEAAESKSNCD